ncbi:MAG: NAD(P)/FAD-dependent oxidoreductase [Paracoccaceae bacterium]
MTRITEPQEYDALIIGARCAGAATALLLARQGARVLVVDHDRPGTDTMSTHALMRGGVFQLRKWGLLDAIVAAGTPAVRSTQFIYEDVAVELEIKPEGGIDALYSPRRYLLDRILAEAAAAAGAELRYETSFRALVRDGQGRVRGARLRNARGGAEEVRAGIVIGADGRRSAVARHVGAQITRYAQSHASCIYRYVEASPEGGNRWYFAPGASGGIIPTNAGQSCVFVAVPPAVYAEATKAEPDVFAGLAARHVPAMAAALSGAAGVGRPVAFRGSPGHLRQAAGPGWALVGDAGYFRDPITAQGITDAFRDAELLAHAIGAGRLADYPAMRDSFAGEIFALTHRIAALDWTMEQIQALHMDLNQAMKENQKRMAAPGGSFARAA